MTALAIAPPPPNAKPNSTYVWNGLLDELWASISDGRPIAASVIEISIAHLPSIRPLCVF